MRSYKILVLLLFLTLASANQEEEALYAPAPPADSAFIRVVQADPELTVGQVKLGDTTLPTLEYGDVTAYYVVKQGIHTPYLNDVQSGDIEVAAGMFYTLAVLGEEGTSSLQLLEDTVSNNPAKASLRLYNFSSVPALDLKTSDGTTTVLENIGLGESKSINVNPIKATLALFSPDGITSDAIEVQFERGASYSFFALGLGEELEAIFVLNSTVTDEE